LPIQSGSIYFSYILKDLLSSLNSKIYLKWPNDFYIDDKKVGGTITELNNGLLYCGIGLNVVSVNDSFGTLDIKIVNINEFLNNYFKALENYPSWKKIISKFKIEFHDKDYFCNKLFKDAVLQNDGSLIINKKKVFSLR